MRMRITINIDTEGTPEELAQYTADLIDYELIEIDEDEPSEEFINFIRREFPNYGGTE